MFKEFKTFIMRGNMMDLAIGVIIGAAFTSIVTSLTEDVLMPIISVISGKPDYSDFFIRLGSIPADFAGDASSYAELKEAGVAMIGLGAFITALINFLIVAFVIFMMIRAVNRVFQQPAPEPEATPEDVLLLREIRDSLQK